jgi:hypothetical protein
VEFAPPCESYDRFSLDEVMLSQQYMDVEAAVVRAESADASEADLQRSHAAAQALTRRLQDGEDSIGMRGSILALAQSKAQDTGDPALFAAVVEAQQAYELAFDMYAKVEALHRRLLCCQKGSTSREQAAVGSASEDESGRSA